MMQSVKQIFSDGEGNLSSGRIVGAILCLVGLIMKIKIFHSLLNGAVNVEHALAANNVPTDLISMGCMLIGSRVLESFIKK